MTTLWGDCFFTEEVSLATNLHHSLSSLPLPTPPLSDGAWLVQGLT